MKRKDGSLFLKLMLIYGVTFVGIALAISLPKVRERPFKNLFKTNINKYAELMANDIGSPANFNKAKKLHEETKIIIAIKQNGEWTYFPSQEAFEAKKWGFKRHDAIVVESRGVTYQFQSPHFSRGLQIYDFLSLILVLVVITLSYFWVRKTFSPLRDISRVADEVAKGNFIAKTNFKGTGELGSIARSMDKMTDQLQSRFDRLRELLRAVSHEVRTPLTSMRLAIESVADDKVKTSLVADIKQLDDLTFNLLEQERIQSSEEGLFKKEHNISEITEEVLALFTDSEINTYLEPNIVVEIDRSRYQLAVRNLLKNAIKHGGSTIKVELRSKNKGFNLIVNDDGPGMDEELINKVGEPFLRSDESRGRDSGGFGLGLSLVHSVVSAHGGELIVENLKPGLRVSMSFY